MNTHNIPPLRYPWWERWASLSLKSYPSVSLRQSTTAIDLAGWFVENHAEDAEQYGWRPVHIMRPLIGLAWRWWSIPDPEITFAPSLIRARIGGLDFLYRAEPSGDPLPLFGSERTSAMAVFHE